MKKYRVSLALNVPSNFEVEVDADTKRGALNRALEKYDDRNFDENEFTDPDWSNAELSIDEKGSIDRIGNGIFVEEVREVL